MTQPMHSSFLRFGWFPRSPLSRSLLVTGLTVTSWVALVPATLHAQSTDAIDATSPAEVAPPAPTEPAIAPAIEPAPVVEVPTVPGLSEAIAPPAGDAQNEAYIDTTDYSLGATERTQPQPTYPTAGLGRNLPANAPSVGVGAIAPSYDTAAIGTTPSLRDFYRRTLRPPGRLGNGNIRLVFPLSIPAPITSLFGWRIHPIFGSARFHSGTDIGAPLGTPVLAAYAGQVVMADFLGGYGLAVALDHNQGKQQTLYAHLSEVFVKSGDRVKQGAVIGRVGSTGNSTGPHLHFEYRELTPDGWVALDAGAQLEYAMAELIKTINVAEKGIVGATGLVVAQRSQLGVSGEIDWTPTPAEANSSRPNVSANPDRPAD